MNPELHTDYLISRFCEYKESERMKVMQMSIYDFFKAVCYRKFDSFVQEEYSKRKKHNS